MGAKRRTSKRKIPLTPEESAWPVGDEQNSGFTLFGKPGDDEYLPRLWREHGDPDQFVWEPGMNSREPR
jgi:hypothetical protein